MRQPEIYDHGTISLADHGTTEFETSIDLQLQKDELELKEKKMIKTKN